MRSASPPSLFSFACLMILIFGLLLSSCSITPPTDSAVTPVSASSADAPEPPSLKLPKLTEQEDTGDLAVTDVFPEYSKARIPSEARVLLISGKADSSSYLNEVLAQRDHWLKMGYQPGEIACYYVKPTEAAYKADKARFDVLAPQTAGFFIASPHLIFEHIRQIGRHNPQFLYLYATSKGQAPIQTYTAPSTIDKVLIRDYPEITDQFFLEMDGAPSGTINERMRVEALDRGFKPEQLFFMPRYLKTALQSLPAKTTKIVALQGCYSGGFMETPLSKAETDTLTSVPQITLLTSARFDRRSFDCEPGLRYTPYGSIFLDLLREHPQHVMAMDWKAFSNHLIQRVDDQEIMKSYGENRLSLPRYFTNAIGSSPGLSGTDGTLGAE